MAAKLRPPSVELLDTRNPADLAATVALLAQAFHNPERYGPERLHDEVQHRSGPHYRHFFVARRQGEIIGVGGLKAADWASATHILYLSAVAEHARGQGVARALIEARIAWVKAHHLAGRILVSTPRPKRFRRLGFKPVGKPVGEERQLMRLEFGAEGTVPGV